MPKYRPTPFFLILAGISVIALSFLLSYFLEIRLLYTYIIAVNLTTFVMYGVDKQQAIYHRFRIPEIVLHLPALAGGSPAALLGQITFRHKTRKRSFRIVFFMIVLLQVAVIAGAFVFRHIHHISG